MPLPALARRAALLGGTALLLAAAGPLPTQQDRRLVPAFHGDRVWNGVTTTPDGRVFVSYPGADKKPGPQVEELLPGGQHRAYPDVGWNTPTRGGDLSHGFVRINALRVGPDGALWLVDAGADGIGKPAVKGGARLFRIDLATNTVSRVYDLATVAKPTSYIDDVRFNGAHAYLTDAGQGAILVLDLQSGAARRVLDGAPATTDERPTYADNRRLRTEDGKDVLIQADQLEVSPDGGVLYFQPGSGPMARIETKWLDDPALTADQLSSHVASHWVDTPTTGGTAIDAAGTIYVTDPRLRRILTVTPDGKTATLIADPRLIWADALWIDGKGDLWIPATQMNLTPGLNGGKMAVHYPVWIYKLPIGAKPAPNDHP